MTYTTLQQAKELIKLGLPENTADMYYEQDVNSSVDSWKVGVGKPNQQQNPCWSAESLLEMLPVTLYNDEGFETHNLELSKDSDNSYTICYSPIHPSDYDVIGDDEEFSESGSLIDVVIKACSWLLTYNYL